MLRRVRAIAVGAGLTVVCYGCATVEPRADYDRAGRFVANATGQSEVYHPGDDALVQGKIDDLMTDGLTSDEAVQVCLLNNPRLQVAFLDIGMARADVVQSGLLSNPSIGISTRFPSGDGLANIDAGLAYNIAELWRIPFRKEAANRDLDRTIMELAQLASALALESKSAYYRSVAAADRYKITQENLSIAGNLLDLAKARQQAGAGTELDVNLARSVMVEAELAVEASRLTASETRRALATLLGLTTPEAELSLVTPLPSEPPELPPSDRVLDVARQARLDIQAAHQVLLSAHARLEQEYRNVFRNVEVGIAMERAERKSQGGRDIYADTARASIANGGLTAPGIQPRSERKRHTDLIIGPSLSLDLPLFDQNQAQIARAEYLYEQAAKTLDALDRELTHEVAGAVDRSETAWRLLKVFRERSVPLAKSNLELSREAYRAGRASFLTVLEAQRFFLDTRGKYVGAAERAAVTIPELERTVGLTINELIQRSRPQTQPKPNEEVDP